MNWCGAAQKAAPPPFMKDNSSLKRCGLPVDLTRNVYCLLGLPIDAVDMEAALRCVQLAASRRSAFLISTLNVNFVVTSHSDPEFRETILHSDLCTADGLPIIWIARMLGLPLRKTVAGSDIFAALKAADQRALSVFLFGGEKGTAAAAADAINATPNNLTCVGSLYPGHGEVEDMSGDEILAEVNLSGADFLMAALGARKGQLWLFRNHHRIAIPVRAHFGAVMNFEAGTVRRAPLVLRVWGLEWAWRIKEEPRLWQRYLRDGLVLLRIILLSVLPLTLLNKWNGFHSRRNPREFSMRSQKGLGKITISLIGDATEAHIPEFIVALKETLTQARTDVILDLSRTRAIDARCFGLFLMLRKRLSGQGAKLEFIGMSRRTKQMFRFSGLAFLLNSETERGGKQTRPSGSVGG